MFLLSFGDALHDDVLTEEENKHEFQNVGIPTLTLTKKVPGCLLFEKNRIHG